MNAHMSWDDLLTFLATARSGGLTGASRALGVHHATVSRRLERLEHDLSVRLFDRHPRGYDLTEAGRELVAHVEAMESQAHAIERRVAGRDQSLTGTVRLTTVDDLAVLVLPEMLAAFHAAYPRLEVEVDVDTARLDLARREADVALRFGSPPQDAGGVRRRLCDTTGAIYATRAYLDAHGTPIAVADLAHHRCVRGSNRLTGLPAESLWDRAGTQAVVRSNSMLVQATAIRSGLGLGYLATFLFEADPGDLVEVPLADAHDFTAGLWLVLHGDLRRSARIRAFADFAGDWVGERRGLLDARARPTGR